MNWWGNFFFSVSSPVLFAFFFFFLLFFYYSQSHPFSCFFFVTPFPMEALMALLINPLCSQVLNFSEICTLENGMSTSPWGSLSSQRQQCAVAVRHSNTPVLKWLVSSNASRLATPLRPSLPTPEAVSHVKRSPKPPPWRLKLSPARLHPEPARHDCAGRATLELRCTGVYCSLVSWRSDRHYPVAPEYSHPRRSYPSASSGSISANVRHDQRHRFLAAFDSRSPVLHSVLCCPSYTRPGSPRSLASCFGTRAIPHP